jgi:hypothetical protein
MVEFEVEGVPPNVESKVTSAALDLGLTVATDGTLSKYPGCRHWHLRKRGRSGTLEVTYWPAKKRLWVTYHSNRVGDGWVEGAAPVVAQMLCASAQPRPCEDAKVP